MVKKLPFLKHNFLILFLPKLKNKLVKTICNLCHRFWFNWDDRQHLNFVKDVYVVGINWPEKVVNWPNLRFVSFLNSQSLLWPMICGNTPLMSQKWYKLYFFLFFRLCLFCNHISTPTLCQSFISKLTSVFLCIFWRWLGHSAASKIWDIQGLPMSLPNNFNDQMYPSDLPILFLVRNV